MIFTSAAYLYSLAARAVDYDQPLQAPLPPPGHGHGPLDVCPPPLAPLGLWCGSPPWLCTALHVIAYRYISFHIIAYHCKSLHVIAYDCIALHVIALHCIELHCIASHLIALMHARICAYISKQW
jgi:hypothetical protein